MRGGSTKQFLGLVTAGTVATIFERVWTSTKETVAEKGFQCLWGEVGAIGLGAALGGVGGDLVLGVLASRMASRREAPGKSTNHDLSIAAGRAIANAVLSDQDEVSSSRKKALQKLAAEVLRAHDPEYEAFSEHSIGGHDPNRLVDGAAGLLEESSPDAAYWTEYLKRLSLRVGGTARISARIHKIAERLAETYPQDFYEALKQDAAGDGKALAGALLRQVSAVLKYTGEHHEEVKRLHLDFRESVEVRIEDVGEALDELAAQQADLAGELLEIKQSLTVLGRIAGDVRSIRSDVEFLRSVETVAQTDRSETKRIASETFEMVREMHHSTALGTDPAVQVKRNRLPAVDRHTVRLIGRSDEARHIERLFEDGTRQVSLVGPPGAGKTSLAKTLAYDLGELRSDLFEHGCCVVQFASLQDPALVLQETVEQFLVKVPAEQSQEEALRECLTGRSVLVVLDNCEHLLEACREAIEVMLEFPEVRVLTTSREPFGDEWEQIADLDPLEVPQDASGDDWEAIRDVEAVQLFLRKASKFRLTKENARHVGTLCQAVAGLPLAIELLAPCSLEYGVVRLAREAKQILQKLGPLRGSIQFSYDALTAEEQTAFRRLSVFDGGWDFEAVEGVLGDEAGALVASLVNKNLVRQDPSTERRSFLEPIRQFSESLRSEEESAQARRDHAAHYVQLAEAVSELLLTPEKGRTIDELETEHDNLRRAIRWSARNGERGFAMRLVAALWRFWEIRGYLSEGRRMVALVLEGAEEAGLEPLRLRVLLGETTLAYRMGQLRESLSVASEARDLAVTLEDEQSAAIALNDMGNAQGWLGRGKEALEAFHECERVHEARGDVRHLAVARFNLGANYYYGSDGEQDDKRALNYLRQSLKGFESKGNRDEVPYPLTILGLLYAEKGEFQVADDYLSKAVELRANSPKGLGESLEAQGWVALLKKKEAQALDRLEAAWEEAKKAGAQSLQAKILDSLALLASAVGEADRGVQVWAACNVFRERSSIVRRERRAFALEKALALLRDDLGEEHFQNLVEVGAGLDELQAAELAFGMSLG